MTYEQTLDYLFEQLPMFTRIGSSAFKKDLTNTLALCSLLNNPQNSFPTVHVAGTNGKGSVSHMLASVLQESGYKTGLYTSPHLRDFRERIRINGVAIDKGFVIDFVENHKKLFTEVKPSFFEWTVALCFHYFSIQKPDIAIIETGLGGRLDSTNVITPILSVITNIGWDHTDMLGDTLEKIAFEKAGIIKTTVPVVIGETQSETASVFTTKASETKSTIMFADQEFSAIPFRTSGAESHCTLHNMITNKRIEVTCDLGGIYQQRNLQTAACSISQLKDLGFNISDEAIQRGISRIKANTGLMGRWQILNINPLTVCDTGHNKNGIAYILQQINHTPHKRLHMVIGMVKDKDIDSLLSLLPKYATYYFCNANIPRALPSEDLKQQAAMHGLDGKHFASVQEAYNAAQKNASADDMIFVGGSTFVVAEVV